MGPSIPRGPSEAQIKTEAQLEEERVRFENERRKFVERVGSYETIASQRLAGEQSSFEVADWAPMDATGLFIPSKFNPSFDPTKFPGQDLSWFNAPNLGINTSNVPTPLPTSTAGRGSGREWVDQYRGLVR